MHVQFRSLGSLSFLLQTTDPKFNNDRQINNDCFHNNAPLQSALMVACCGLFELIHTKHHIIICLVSHYIHKYQTILNLEIVVMYLKYITVFGGYLHSTTTFFLPPLWNAVLSCHPFLSIFSRSEHDGCVARHEVEVMSLEWHLE